MQDNRIVPVFARSPAEPHQEQVNNSAPLEPHTHEFVDLRLDDQQTPQIPQVPSDPEILQAAQALLELHTSQPLTPAERHAIQQNQIVEETPFGWVPYDNYIQAIDLASQPDRLTANPRSATPSPWAESSPERPIIIAVPNSAPIATLHFIEINIFHYRQNPRQVWEELWEQNNFMPLETMLGILQQWRVILEIALFRLPSPMEALSPPFRAILERYRRLVQRGQSRHLRKSWQLLTAILDVEENPE